MGKSLVSCFLLTHGVYSLCVGGGYVGLSNYGRLTSPHFLSPRRLQKTRLAARETRLVKTPPVYWHCPRSIGAGSMHRSGVRSSVLPSIGHSSIVCYGGPAGRRYRSIAARRTAARRANAGCATLSAYVVAEHRQDPMLQKHARCLYLFLQFRRRRRHAR